MTRSQVREQIFKLLFRIEFNSAGDMEEQVRLFFEVPPLDDEDRTDTRGISGRDGQYIKDKYERIVSRLAEIDALIEETAKGWSMARIGKVELTILRLAVYELKYDDDIPPRVAINEGVELAKKYGQEGAGSFVNGVLAKLV